MNSFWKIIFTIGILMGIIAFISMPEESDSLEGYKYKTPDTNEIFAGEEDRNKDEDFNINLHRDIKNHSEPVQIKLIPTPHESSEKEIMVSKNSKLEGDHVSPKISEDHKLEIAFLAPTFMKLDANGIRNFLQENKLESPRAIEAQSIDWEKQEDLIRTISGSYEGYLVFPDNVNWRLSLDIRIEASESLVRGEVYFAVIDAEENTVMQSQVFGSLDKSFGSLEVKDNHLLSLTLIVDDQAKTKIFQLFFNLANQDSMIIGNFYFLKNRKYSRAVPFFINRNS